MDPCFLDDSAAIPYVDVATRFTFISKIENVEPEMVWGDLTYVWIEPRGIREQIACDAGGEFPSNSSAG